MNNTENRTLHLNNEPKIENMSKNNLKKQFDINNNNNINKGNEYNSYDKRMNYNYSYQNNIHNINNKLYDFNNISSIHNKPSSNSKLFHKATVTSYIYKTKNSLNSNTIHSTRNNINNLNSLNTSNNIYISNSYRNISPNQKKNQSNQKIQSSINNKNKIPLFIKINPKILNNHCLKVINNSSSNKRKENSENTWIKNSYINNKNNYYANKYKTKEIDINYSENNNYGNKLTRINKYKILRNRAIQNNNNH